MIFHCLLKFSVWNSYYHWMVPQVGFKFKVNLTVQLPRAKITGVTYQQCQCTILIHIILETCCVYEDIQNKCTEGLSTRI